MIRGYINKGYFIICMLSFLLPGNIFSMQRGEAAFLEPAVRNTLSFERLLLLMTQIRELEENNLSNSACYIEIQAEYDRLASVIRRFMSEDLN